jgi:hypothetical protein
VCYIELVDHYTADDCQKLRFEMDCGRAFAERFGKAICDVTELRKIIEHVIDIKLLGSAIYRSGVISTIGHIATLKFLSPRTASGLS